MIISNIRLIIRELIFLLLIIFDIISRVIKGEIEDKRGSNYSIFILINRVNAYINNREDILLIDKDYKISFAS